MNTLITAYESQVLAWTSMPALPAFTKADLRAGLPWGRYRLWIGARATCWVRGQSVRIDARTTSGSATNDLPPWSLEGALGLSCLLP